MEEEIMKDAVRTTLEETEHTFIPKMIGLRAHISVRIVSSEINNRPKMVICEQKTLKNLHDLPLTQRIVTMLLHPHQTCELNSIEVNVGTKSKKFTPTLKLKQSRIISLEYLFNWDNFTENDNEKLIKFLRDKFNIDLEENVAIEKTDETINIPETDPSVTITMDNKEKATVKIIDGRTHELKVKTENGKRNIYFFDSEKVISEKYNYVIPYISPQNKGETVTTKAEYEWSPCDAIPDTSDSDEFTYELNFPTKELVIKMIAEDSFYFTKLDRKVIDWSGKEIDAVSGPIVTKIIPVDDEERIKEAEWNVTTKDLTHLNSYEIQFWLGEM
jgi:transcription termination factor NusB